MQIVHMWLRTEDAIKSHELYATLVDALDRLGIRVTLELAGTTVDASGTEQEIETAVLAILKAQTMLVAAGIIEGPLYEALEGAIESIDAGWRFSETVRNAIGARDRAIANVIEGVV